MCKSVNTQQNLYSCCSDCYVASLLDCKIEKYIAAATDSMRLHCEDAEFEPFSLVY